MEGWTAQQLLHREEVEVHLSRKYGIADRGEEALEIPVVDLQGLFAEEGNGGLSAAQKSERMSAIGRACKELGFFQIINHGVPEDLLNRMKKAGRGFFNLTPDERMACAAGAGEAHGPQGLTSKRLQMGDNAFMEYVDLFYLALYPKHHRDVERWPPRQEEYRPLLEDYSLEILKLVEKLLTILSQQLGLKHDQLEKSFGSDPNLSMRVNYYPPCEMEEDQPSLGLGSHSDPGGITLLLQGDVAGLQVLREGQWIDVHPVPNAFVVNVGDQLEILSNGIYKSVNHRGLAPVGHERMSVAMFYSPATDTIISPAGELVDESHPALYKGMTFGDYLASFFKNGLKGKQYLERAK